MMTGGRSGVLYNTGNNTLLVLVSVPAMYLA